MRNLIPIAVLMIFALVSCQNKKSKSENNELNTTQSKNIQAQIELGEKLYSENICNACHLDKHSDLGPSTKSIVDKYNADGKSITEFLQGKSEPIVDTNKVQIAIMKMNIDTFVKELSSEEIKAIETYMQHSAKN